MLPDRQVAAVTRRYQQLLERHARNIAAATGRAWVGLGSWDEADVAAYAARTLRLHLAAKQTAVSLASAYLSTIAQEALVGVPVESVPALVPDPREPFTALWHQLKAGTPFDEALDAGRSAAEGRSRSQVFRASRQTGDQWAARSGQQVVGWRRVLTGSSCEWCAVVSTQRYKTAESADFGHTNCVIGSTVVRSATARRLSRRRYQGELVVVRCASGDELTITPNHPVLTDGGWVRADLLHEGLDVVRRSAVERDPVVVPHEHHVPPSVEDRFRAASVAQLVRMPFAAEDFHGDAGHGDVDVVPADWNLTLWPEASAAQEAEEMLLAGGRLGRVRMPRLCREHQALLAGRPATFGRMGSGDTSLTFGGSHSSGALERSFASASASDSGLFDHSLDSAPAHSVGLLEREFALPALVAFEESFRHLDPLGSSCYLATSELAVQDTGTDAAAGRRLLNRLARDVEIDRIVELRRISGTQDVYNLSTEDGWYSANGIVVHNCDCATIPIIGDADPGRFLLGDLYDNVSAGRVSERIDENRRAADQLSRADSATRRRDDALVQLARETDPERRLRLEQRARKWDDRAAHHRAKAATEATRGTSIAKPGGHTGYVDDHGRPMARPG